MTPDITPEQVIMPPETLAERMEADGRIFRLGVEEGRLEKQAEVDRLRAVEQRVRAVASNLINNGILNRREDRAQREAGARILFALEKDDVP